MAACKRARVMDRRVTMVFCPGAAQGALLARNPLRLGHVQGCRQKYWLRQKHRLLHMTPKDSRWAVSGRMCAKHPQAPQGLMCLLTTLPGKR